MLQDAANMLLQNAIGVIPIAIVVAVLCKAVPMRPATRHTLWLGVLVFLIIPPTLPQFSRSLLQTTPATQTDLVVAEPGPATIIEAIPLVKAEPPTKPVVVSNPKPLSKTLDHRRAVATKTREQIAQRRALASRESIQVQLPLDSMHASTKPANPPARTASVAEDNPEPPVILNEQSANPTQFETAQVFLRSTVLVANASIDRAQSWATAGIDTVRSAVGAVPRIPGWLWFGGVTIVLATGIIRLFLASRLIRHATPAPASVQALIDSAAEQMGLRRAPRTLMVADHVSPMVWCGRRLTLILPRTLWSELDDSGRRAVVQHELAHIRRRDHWVRWAELLIGTLYWWHPIVWWARRRVREEADLSCDLWVTALMPGVRASYARALLRTKQYVSAGDRGVPSVGIGAVSPGAKCFTRRITMVMTTRMNPKASIVGVALAASLVLGGVYSAPSWACDTPEPHKPLAVPSAPEHPHHAEDLSTFEQYMIDRAPAPEASDCDEANVSHAPECDEDWRSDRVVSSFGAINGKIHSMVTGQSGYSSLAFVGDNNEMTVTYHLKGDRLKGLVKLMSREDVPILVEPIEDGIIVHGNAEQQRRFGSFVALLAPKETILDYRVTNSGKLQDLTSLLALDSVPTRISPNDESIRMHGDANTQRAFSEFLVMIDPGSSKMNPRKDWDESQALRSHGQHPLEHEAAKVEMRVLGMFEEAQRLREMEAALMEQARAIEMQAEEVEHQSDEQREHADSMLEEIEALLDHVESMSEEEQYEAMIEAEHAQREASRLMRFAEAIETQVDHVVTQAESLAHEASRFGLQADELEEQAEELAESLEEQLEDLEEMLEDRVDEFNDWTSEHAESLRELLEEHAERLDEELTRRLEHSH